MPDHDIVEELATLLARHKLVPFLGAGISRAQLGFAAPGLRTRLAAGMTPPPDPCADLAQVAEDIERRQGCGALMAELKRHLHRDEFDDALSTTHLLAFSLDCGLLYTTNQDNLFELAAAKFGRPHRIVVTLADLAEAEPGDRLYVKFHGDPAVPDSVVVTEGSYARRLAEPDNFLDVRLRSDLLGRGLLFIGYSLQDENLRQLLRRTRRAFHGGTPASYLVAFDYEPEMEGMAAEFGVTVVNPAAMFPGGQGNAVAFERCLQAVCTRTLQLKTRKALDSMFVDRVAVPILIEHELVGLEAAAQGDVLSGLRAFRAAVDATQVPAHLQRRVAEVADHCREGCQRGGAGGLQGGPVQPAPLSRALPSRDGRVHGRVQRAQAGERVRRRVYDRVPLDEGGGMADRGSPRGGDAAGWGLRYQRRVPGVRNEVV